MYKYGYHPEIDNKTALCIREAYGDFIESKTSHGYMPFMITFKFAQLPPSHSANIIETMLKDVEHVYQRLLNRFARHPFKPSEKDFRPILVAAADLPVPKKNKKREPLHRPNDGLHVHGIFLQPPRSRFKGSFSSWLQRNEAKIISGTSLCELHIVPLSETPGYATTYVLKTVGKRLSLDEILVLPRAASERPRSTDAGYDAACRTIHGTSLMRPGWKRM